MDLTVFLIDDHEDAREALDAVAKDEAIIVIPSRARFLWRVGRLLPALSEKAGGAAIAKERATRGLAHPRPVASAIGAGRLVP